MKPFRNYTLPALVWMAGIFVSSSIPGEDFPDVGFWGWAKLIHLFYYCVLCFLIYRTLLYHMRSPALFRHAFLVAILLATVYGATDELHQLYTPGRHGQFSDVLIDGLGASLFWVGSKVHSVTRPKEAPTKHS